MRLLILGATGRTGGRLLEQALAEGHQVTVLVRDSRRLGAADPGLQVRVGGVSDAAAVSAAVEGQDAVLVVLGSRRPRELFGTDLMVSSVGNVVSAMQRH